MVEFWIYTPIATGKQHFMRTEAICGTAQENDAINRISNGL